MTTLILRESSHANAPDSGTTMKTPDVVSHEEALSALLEGNARYQAGTNCALNPCPTTISLDSGQSPFAAFIRCADSRVAPEIVFDQPLGSLFVCGVAGNIPTMEIVASLEYAVCVLGTKLIVIMGHSSCGAVTASLEDETARSRLPGNLPELIERIHGHTRDVPPNSDTILDDAIAANARCALDQLLQMSDVIRDMVEREDVQVIAGVEDLKSGQFKVLRHAFKIS